MDCKWPKLAYCSHPCWKKTIETCPKHNRKCNGFNGYNGNCIGFSGNYNGVLMVCDGFYWWDVKSHCENAQNTLQKGFF